jgi:hypothetical protein
MELAATLTAYKTLPRKSTPRRPSHHWCWWTLTLNNKVLSSYKQLEGNENASHKELLILKQYDFPKLRCVPQSMTSKEVRGDGRWLETEWTVKHVDWTPVPDNIFMFEAEGISRGSVWIRRLIMLASGIAIFGVVLLYHKFKKHA